MKENAASTIHLNQGYELIHNILEAQIAKKILNKLKGLYMRKKFNEQLVRGETALWLVDKGSSNLLEHLNVFNILNIQLSNFGVKVKPSYKQWVKPKHIFGKKNQVNLNPNSVSPNSLSLNLDGLNLSLSPNNYKLNQK